MERRPPFAPISTLEATLPPPPRSARRYRKPRLWIFRVPWTLYGYLSGEILQVFLLATLAVSMAYGTLAAYQAARSGLQVGILWPLLLKTLAYPLYFSIPLSLLFAVTLVLGRMSSELEISAMKTHGLAHGHLYAPILGLGLALGLVSYYVSGWIIPSIHYERRNLQEYVLQQLEGLGTGINRTLLLPDGDGSLWVGYYDGTSFQNVRLDLEPTRRSSFVPFLKEHLADRLPQQVTVYARTGSVELAPDRKAMVLTLSSVEIYVPELVKSGAIQNEVFHQRLALTSTVRVPLSFRSKRPGNKDLSTPRLLNLIGELDGARAALEAEEAAPEEEGLAFATHHERPGDGRASATVDRHLNLPGAGAASREVGGPGGEGASIGAGAAEPAGIQKVESRLRSARVELHKRLSFALSSLTFPLVGVALSLLLESWSRILPFFLGNLLVIALYYPLLTVGVAMAERNVSPGLALLLPNAVLAALGAFLATRAFRR